MADQASQGFPASTPPLLALLARRVRELRRGVGWSRAELARHSGLSTRFLARVEAGEGNISVLRLEALARALQTGPAALLRAAPEKAAIVSLVGLRGAGKSSVGPALAERLACPFIEMDSWILEAAGLPLDQVFELHGERYYRRLELEVARRIVAGGGPAVVAAAGGVVNEPDTWRLLRERTQVVWLRARAEDHWSRVIAQGDRRPMADNPAAMEELRAMLTAREKVYGQADLICDTSGRRIERVADWIAEHLPRNSSSTC